MARSRTKPAVLTGVLAAAVGLAVLVLDLLGVLKPVSLELGDIRFHARTIEPSGRITLVDIDAKSLGEIGVWPWPRQLHAQLVDQASALGAAQIAFDVDFSTRSTAPADEAFADALMRTDADVLLATFIQRGTAAGDSFRPAVPIEPLLSSSWPALVNVPLDTDGIVRRFPTAMIVNDETVQSMPVLVSAVESAPDEIGIDYSIDAGALRRVSYVDLLNGRVDREAIAGKSLIVGATALELRDLHYVPRGEVISGSTIIALAAETLLHDRSIERVDITLPLLAVAGAVGVSCLLLTSAGVAVLLLASTAAALEAVAIALQSFGALSLDTSGAHLFILALGALALGRELAARGGLLRIARASVRNRDHLLDRVIEDGFDGVVLFDAAGRVLRVNGTARDLLGCSAKHGPKLLGEFPWPLVKAIEARSGLPPGMRTGNTAERFECELEVNAEPGELDRREPRVLECQVVPIHLETAEDAVRRPEESILTCLTVRDVTVERRAADALRHLAMHDSLTGLRNRRAIELAIGSANLSGGAHALICFDLDRFKIVNDSLGHAVGDVLLKEVGQRAAKTLGVGCIVARCGGDEFAALLPATSAELSRRRAGDLNDAMARPFEVLDHRITTSASIGVRWFEPGSASPSDLLRQGDLALYASKRSGRGCVTLFEPRMEQDLTERAAMERDLIEAFDRGDFEVFFQPQVSLATGQFTGAEALVRWNRCGRGYVSPGVFIPIVEETGLIHRLGEFVLETACREAVSWPEPLKVAVNVSSIEMEAGDVPGSVRRALGATGLSASRLELEITESAFLRDSPLVSDRFSEIRNLGVVFALDDFGTGYSSLSYLHRYPMAKIKIDQSFIGEIPADATAMGILRSIVTLAESLGMRTIAEGIETEEQVEILRLLGCGDGQGYLFSRPITAAAMRNLLRTPQASAGTVSLPA